MRVPNFLLPTNFRHSKNIKRLIKEFDVQGYGIALYLLETLAESENHIYPYSDIDLLADEMRVSINKIETVIQRYQIFELINTNSGEMFISRALNDWLKPYYNIKEQRQLAGKISAEKRRIKQERLISELSEIDSIQRPLNDRSTINKLINKSIKKSSSFNQLSWENQKDFECFFKWLKIKKEQPIENERSYQNTILKNLKNQDVKTIENWDTFVRWKTDEEKMIFLRRIDGLVGSVIIHKGEQLYVKMVNIDEIEEKFTLYFQDKIMNLQFAQLEEIEKIVKKD